LLADGNLGIGGEPVTLLARLRTLLTSHGQVLVELDPLGSGAHQLTVRLEHADGAASVWFPWARVGVEAIDEIACRRSCRSWSGGRRPGAGSPLSVPVP
jgi:hypothetical protein